MKSPNIVKKKESFTLIQLSKSGKVIIPMNKLG